MCHECGCTVYTPHDKEYSRNMKQSQSAHPQGMMRPVPGTVKWVKEKKPSRG